MVSPQNSNTEEGWKGNDLQGITEEDGENHSPGPLTRDAYSIETYSGDWITLDSNSKKMTFLNDYKVL